MNKKPTIAQQLKVAHAELDRAQARERLWRYIAFGLLILAGLAGAFR